MPRVSVSLAWLAMLAACEAERPRSDRSLLVDDYLTPVTSFGAELVVSGTVHGCSGIVPAVAYADGVEVAREVGVLIYEIDLSQLGQEPRLVFQMTIPGAALDAERWGLPVAFGLELEIDCEGESVRSPPYAVAFVPTAAGLLPPFNPRRFWPADTPGDLLVCEGTRLTRYAGGTAAAAFVELGFVCATAELRGDPGDDRLYLVAPELGIAALGPAPTLHWARVLRVGAAWVESAGADPLVIDATVSDDALLVLDRASGATLVGPIALPRPTRGDPVRDAAGDLLVIEAERPGDLSTLTYHVRRFDAAGALIGTVLLAHYGWNTPSPRVTFDPTGAFVYVTAAPDEATRFVQKVDIGNCAPDCAVVWATLPAERWESPQAEIYGRLFVTSPTDFGWLDAADGTLSGSRFATASGSRFFRASVEADGSIAMIADGLGDVAQGLYVFGPDGASVLRLRGSDVILRWLVGGWDGGSLVSYKDELHELYPRSHYSELLGN